LTWFLSRVYHTIRSGSCDFFREWDTSYKRGSTVKALYQDEGMLEESLSMVAEAAQDLASAGLEQALGRYFACADLCNQVVEKSLQAVHVFRAGHRAMYDHDLGALAERVDAPPEVLAAAQALLPYHPEAFYAHTPPEAADEAISAETAQQLAQQARQVLRWARGIIVLAP
jgi:HEPN domain-containing protein